MVGREEVMEEERVGGEGDELLKEDVVREEVARD